MFFLWGGLGIYYFLGLWFFFFGFFFLKKKIWRVQVGSATLVVVILVLVVVDLIEKVLVQSNLRK